MQNINWAVQPGSCVTPTPAHTDRDHAADVLFEDSGDDQPLPICILEALLKVCSVYSDIGPPNPTINKPYSIALSKKYKNRSCRDALPAKNTSPKTNKTSDNAHRKACTDYPHITARCVYRAPTIPTSFQPHPSNDVYVRWE